MDADTAQAADDARVMTFIRNLSAARVALWWILFVADLAIGAAHWTRTPNKKRWLLYYAILGVTLLWAIKSSAYLSYVDAARGNRDDVGAVSGAYIFFSNLCGGAFIGLVMLLAVGFCMTRMDLGLHKGKVIWCPLLVLVCGLTSDYLFYYLETVDYADQVYLDDATSFEIMLWSIATIVKLSALLFAWMYVVEAIKYEIATLEASKAATEARIRGDDVSDAHAPALQLANSLAGNGYQAEMNQQQQAAHTEPGSMAYKALLDAGQNSSHAGSRGGRMGGRIGGLEPNQAALPVQDGLSPEAVRQVLEDVERQKIETVEDQVEFVIKLRLLSHFRLGVMAYVAATIATYCIPLLVVEGLQNTIRVLEFVIQFAFMAALIVLFRPIRENPYLMAGVSAEDADMRGVGEFSTELSLVEDGPSRPVAPVDEASPAGSRAGRHHHHPRGRGGAAAPSSSSAGRGRPEAAGPTLPVSSAPPPPARPRAAAPADFNKNFSLE